MHPDRGEIEVEDTLTFPDAVPGVEFLLNTGLEPTTSAGRLQLTRSSPDGMRTAYRLTLPEPRREVTLRYRGKPRFADQRSMGGMPVGEVSADGVYLDERSAWYPVFDQVIGGMDLTVTVPEGWKVLSIGRYATEKDRQRWTTDRLHDELYLIAGPFRRYARAHRDIDLSVWLLQDDPELAGRYLAVMGDYLDHYGALIAPYPYEKFAVVENRWQTGFGMPSFTLLGSRVMRLPFIPYTSLPHEILHNWWGNGVWIDYDKGNWSEGLTAYLADHWMKERRGQGDQYRLKALQRYTNFAAEGRDSPLLSFVSRHGDASQSIGYSKSLMLFHMLRRSMGDERFAAGLQRVWARHRFSRIGFEQVLRTLSSEDDALDADWLQWLQRTGAPKLRLGEVRVVQQDGKYELQLELLQDRDTPFALDVPLAVTVDGRPEARVSVHRITAGRQVLTLRFDARPLRVDVDPRFDVLRELDPGEQPAALNRLFGTSTWLILPAAADDAMRVAWEALARQWRKRYPGLQTIRDDLAGGLPEDANRLILGWENASLPAALSSLQRDDHSLRRDALQHAERVFPASDTAIALVASKASGVTLGFLGADSPDTVAMLARKLPHYGSYGRLAFDAATGERLLADSLPSLHSPLSRQLTDAATPLRLAPRAVLGKDPKRTGK